MAKPDTNPARNRSADSRNPGSRVRAPRGDEVFGLDLGAVVSDVDGEEWVFLGWARNTRGREAFFARSMHGRPVVPGSLWTYHASTAEALLRKFPGLAERLAGPVALHRPR